MSLSLVWKILAVAVVTVRWSLTGGGLARALGAGAIERLPKRLHKLLRRMNCYAEGFPMTDYRKIALFLASLAVVSYWDAKLDAAGPSRWNAANSTRSKGSQTYVVCSAEEEDMDASPSRPTNQEMKASPLAQEMEAPFAVGPSFGTGGSCSSCGSSYACGSCRKSRPSCGHVFWGCPITDRMYALGALCQDWLPERPARRPLCNRVACGARGRGSRGCGDFACAQYGGGAAKYGSLPEVTTAEEWSGSVRESTSPAPRSHSLRATERSHGSEPERVPHRARGNRGSNSTNMPNLTPILGDPHASSYMEPNTSRPPAVRVANFSLPAADERHSDILKAAAAKVVAAYGETEDSLTPTTAGLRTRSDETKEPNMMVVLESKPIPMGRANEPTNAKQTPSDAAASSGIDHGARSAGENRGLDVQFHAEGTEGGLRNDNGLNPFRP